MAHWRVRARGARPHLSTSISPWVFTHALCTSALSTVPCTCASVQLCETRRKREACHAPLGAARSGQHASRLHTQQWTHLHLQPPVSCDLSGLV